LLVVDRVDHHLRGAAVLAALLQQAAGVKLVVTSRVRLRLQGETVCEVRGLSTPTGPEDLERSGAGRLLLEAAARVRPDAPLSPAERAAAAEVCRQLDGCPLAILQAADCLRSVTCADLAVCLAAGQELPAVPSPDRPARQHSLRAALDAAWAPLSDAERATLRRLAEFRGPFARAAAAGAGAETADLLGLVDAGLVDRVDDGHYALTARVRRYAAGRLAADPADAAAVAGRRDAFSAGDARAGAPSPAWPAGGQQLDQALALGLERGPEPMQCEAARAARAPAVDGDLGRDAEPGAVMGLEHARSDAAECLLAEALDGARTVEPGHAAEARVLLASAPRPHRPHRPATPRPHPSACSAEASGVESVGELTTLAHLGGDDRQVLARAGEALRTTVEVDHERTRRDAVLPQGRLRDELMGAGATGGEERARRSAGPPARSLRAHTRAGPPHDEPGGGGSALDGPAFPGGRLALLPERRPTDQAMSPGAASAGARSADNYPERLSSRGRPPVAAPSPQRGVARAPPRGYRYGHRTGDMPAGAGGHCSDQAPGSPQHAA
jgi:hypothetical protein